MKTIRETKLGTLVLIIAFCVSLSAQKIGKPTLIPTNPTEAQDKLISEGIKLHDLKMYREAIAKYKQVIAENPDCAVAMYELALSQYYNGELDKASATSYRLVKYIGDTGVLGYGLIANVLDDRGNPEAAIGIYQGAIKLLEQESENASHVASFYHNLGVTFSRQRKYKDAKKALKNAIERDKSYVSPNSLLAAIFAFEGNRVPGFLAATRVLSIDFNTKNSRDASNGIVEFFVPKKNVRNPIYELPRSEKMLEGDFSRIESYLETADLKTGVGEIDTKKFATAVERVITLLAEDSKLHSTFVGKTYIPFMSALKNQGYIEPFVNIVLWEAGNEKSRLWLIENDEKLNDFLTWAKGYRRLS